MKRLIYAGIFFLLTQNIISAATTNNKEENKNCLKCHSWSTLGFRDKESGLLVNLSVNPDNFYTSNHKILACVECHSKDFTVFPHSNKLKEESLYCLDCHTDKKELSKYSFKNIEKDFKKSIHYLKLGNQFTCFNCHEPHSFKVNARVNTQIEKIVLYDNRICLDCHNSSSKIAALTKDVIPSLNESHKWLPHLELHWANVRCIDCHAPENTAGVPHEILPKEKAVKNCVNCHSENSILLQSLYKFQSVQKRNEQGFINATILNNSYVIGATRNYYLNLFSFIIFGITIIFLGLHGYFRYKSRINENKNEN
ncbi:MAG TPA: cytochrome c3 family protein [Ignavibacteriaceae bacterium]|nr:cytochrome c3 family protein [Ignavibacteriaceae bacterium]